MDNTPTHSRGVISPALPSMTNPGLGRIYSPDARDINYPMRNLVKPSAVVGITHRNWYADGAWLDQGNTGTCVGHAWAHWFEDGPYTHPGTIDPFAIYDLATELDEWPGNEHDRDAGTSTRAGCEALIQMGHVSSYHWAFDVETIRDTILTLGPVVVGTNWYTGMFDPWPDGKSGYRPILKPGGSIAGGHEYVLDGVNIVEEWFRMKNSWGRGWAYNGFAWIRFADMERLLNEDGDAAIAVEIKS